MVVKVYYRPKKKKQRFLEIAPGIHGKKYLSPVLLIKSKEIIKQDGLSNI